MELDDLYRRVILDHYKTPRNRGKFTEGAVIVELNNPTCGDRIELQLLVEGGVVKDAKFMGEGCSISIASASMMTDAVKDQKFADALQLADNFSALMKGEPIEFEYEDIEALSGVNKFTARIKCATLGWNALRKSIELCNKQDQQSANNTF